MKRFSWNKIYKKIKFKGRKAREERRQELTKQKSCAVGD